MASLYTPSEKSVQKERENCIGRDNDMIRKKEQGKGDKRHRERTTDNKNRRQTRNQKETNSQGQSDTKRDSLLLTF